MGGNPLVELLLERIAAGDAAALDVTIAHRGAPGDRRSVPGREIARVTGHAIVLLDGTELPLHRVLEVRAGDDVLWARPKVQ